MVNDVHDIEVPCPIKILDQGCATDDSSREDELLYVPASANTVES